MDASPPSPRSGENVSDVPLYYQETLQTAARARFGLLRDLVMEAKHLTDGEPEHFDRAEVLREVRDLQAELEVLATLLEHYPEEDDE
jgi:hypothetical protein